MRLDEGLDTGDILLQREMQILPQDTAITLAPRLAATGADLLLETLRGLEQGSVARVPQDQSQATLAPILKKEDGLIDFDRTAIEIHNRLRGFQPWPGAYTLFRSKNLKIIEARPSPEMLSVPKGELHVQNEKLFVGCGKGSALELIQLQPEGKKAITAREFLSGYRPVQGEKLG